MDTNFYMINRQKLLFIAEELHKRGFGKLRVVPSLSPSGIYWRCNFISETKKHDFAASNWICNQEKENEEIKLTIIELTNLFAKENSDFIEKCKGENKEYTEWYSRMLKQLTKEELPYAIADWKIPKGVWRTSEDKEITTLPNEDKYYFKI
jgi:predicted nucleic-acid-binding Zn-ribbon protein